MKAKTTRDYVDAMAYRRKFPAGRPFAKADDPGNRKPQDDTPVGSWRIDAFKGIYGHDIEQLRNVHIKDIAFTELDREGRLSPNKRGDDEIYAHWISEGFEPPPIHLVEREDGMFAVTDGHRRALAQIGLGRKKLKAWVSPLAPHPEGLHDAYGKPMFVGLTREILEALDL